MALVATGKDPAVTIRFPKDLLRRLTKAAKAEGRSRNTEIVKRLEDSFRGQEQPQQSAAGQ